MQVEEKLAQRIPQGESFESLLPKIVRVIKGCWCARKTKEQNPCANNRRHSLSHLSLSVIFGRRRAAI